MIILGLNAYHADASACLLRDGVPFMMQVYPTRPQEALDCFLRTKMDVLVMGGWFVSR